MGWNSQSQEQSPRPDASATGHIEDVERTTDGWLFILLEIIIDEAEDEGRL